MPAPRRNPPTHLPVEGPAGQLFPSCITTATEHHPRAQLRSGHKYRGTRRQQRPPQPEEIAEIYNRLAYSYPKAEIMAASLPRSQPPWPLPRSLPVVTEEIGDTWIDGCASDPLKVARYREVARLRQSWIRTALGSVSATIPTWPSCATCSSRLEHTWGTDTKTWLDFDQLHPRRSREDARHQKLQGRRIQLGLRSARTSSMASLRCPWSCGSRPNRPSRRSSQPCRNPGANAVSSLRARDPFETNPLRRRLRSSDPALLLQLQHNTDRPRMGRQISILLALFTYQTLSQDRLRPLLRQVHQVQSRLGLQRLRQAQHRLLRRKSQEWLPKSTDLYLGTPPIPSRHRHPQDQRPGSGSTPAAPPFPGKIYIELVCPANNRSFVSTFTASRNQRPECRKQSGFPSIPRRRKRRVAFDFAFQNLTLKSPEKPSPLSMSSPPATATCTPSPMILSHLKHAPQYLLRRNPRRPGGRPRRYKPLYTSPTNNPT